MSEAQKGWAGPVWRIEDIITEGSSLVKNYRQQFTRIIKKDGFPELMRRMKAKLASGGRGRRALASYGLHGRAAAAAWAGTIAVEALLGLAVAAGVPGGVGGVVSAWVVTGSVLLGWETLPAASDAVT